MKLLISGIKIGSAAALQVLLFCGVWIGAVEYARSHERFPPGRFLELTFVFGVFGFALAALICSAFALLGMKRLHLLVLILGCVAVWAVSVLPAVEERPIAVPVFLLIGGGVLVFVSGLFFPSFTWFVDEPARKRSGAGEGE